MRGTARSSATALTVLILAAFQRPSTGNDGQIKILSGFTHASSSAERAAENRLVELLSPTCVDRDFREPCDTFFTVTRSWLGQTLGRKILHRREVGANVLEQAAPGLCQREKSLWH